jgi:hypothetical protein
LTVWYLFFIILISKYIRIKTNFNIVSIQFFSSCYSGQVEMLTDSSQHLYQYSKIFMDAQDESEK